MSIFERYLTIWIFMCIIIGVDIVSNVKHFSNNRVDTAVEFRAQ